MSAYGDVHRRFLQSFVYHPTQTETEAKEIYKLVCQEQGVEESNFRSLIEAINAYVRKHTSLEIKSGFCELTGEKYYVACNTADLKWIRQMAFYNKNEQLLFSKIFDSILRSESGNVSSITCLNTAGVGNMSKSDVSASITKFVTQKWFTQKKGRLYMGVRAAVELEAVVVEHYENVKSVCPLCKKIIFWGHQCGSCPEVTHLHCLKKFFASAGVEIACPSCSVPWPDWQTAHEIDSDDSS